MADYLAGRAVAQWLLDATAGERTLAQLEKRLRAFEVLQKQALLPPALSATPAPAATPRSAGGSGIDPAVLQQRAERAILARANAEARLAQVQNTGEKAVDGLRRAQLLYEAALRRVDQTSIAAVRAQTQLAAVQNRLKGITTGGQEVLGRTVERFGADAIGQFKSGLLGIVGPAAIAGVALGALASAGERVRSAFLFKAQLDATNAAITAQLRPLRDSATVFGEAQQFANRYKLTQSELTDALSTSIGVMRISNAGTQDILTTFGRLQTLAPDKSIGEAARAVRELASGDTTSIKELFNVSARDANRMKQEIQGGADAIKVITAFLDDAQIGMEGLEARASGAAGKIKDLAVQQERFNLALAGQAGGAGEGLLDFRINALKELGALLSGDFRDVEARNAGRAAAQVAYNTALAQGKTDAEAYAAAQQANVSAAQEYAAWAGAAGEATKGAGGAALQSSAGFSLQSQAMIDTANAAQIERDKLAELAAANADAAQKAVQDTAAKQVLTAQTELLDAKTRAAAEAFLLANPGIDESGIRAAVTAKLIPALTGEIAILTGQVREAKAELGALSGGRPERGGDALNRFIGGQQKVAAFIDRQAAAAEKARQAQILALGTDREKLKVLQNQLAAQQRQFGVGSAEVIQAETALKQEQERQKIAAKRGAGGSASKGLSALDRDAIKLQDDLQGQLNEVNRQLERGNLTAHQRNQLLIQQADLVEKIANEQERATRAVVDAQLGQVRDAQARIKEARERAGLERQLQSARFSQSQQEAAQLRIREIDLEQQKRLLDINKDIRTAGGAVPPGTAPPVGAVPIPVGPAVPTGAPALPFPQAPALAALPPPIVNLNLTIQIDERGQARVVGAPANVNIIAAIVEHQRGALAGGG